MSILIGRDTRLVVQGITGREGDFHAGRCWSTARPLRGRRDAGQGRPDRDRRPGAGVRHGRRGRPRDRRQHVVHLRAGGRRAGRRARVVAAGIGTIFCITEGIPALDMIPVVEEVRLAGARLIGPNCPGATSPGQAKVGIIPGSIHREGRVGVVSPSGTLTYEAVQAMTDAGHRPVDVRRDRRRPDHRHARSVDVLRAVRRRTRRPTRSC